MTSVSRVLAVWLTPVALLAAPAALCARAGDGLWLGLTLTLVPLIVVGLSARRAAAPGGPGRAERASLFPVVTVILARIVLGERITRHQEAGIAGALTGVALIAAG
jgi:hypothetical protein